MQSSTSTSSSETPMEWLARRKAAFALGACKDVYRVTIWCLEVLLRWTIADKIALKISGRAAAVAWIDISLFLQEADRGEDLDNIVRTLSYRKLPEEKTEMTKPAENETSKQPQSWAEAAKAAGILVLSSQEQFNEVIIETAPKKSVTKKTSKEYRLEEPK